VSAAFWHMVAWYLVGLLLALIVFLLLA